MIEQVTPASLIDAVRSHRAADRFATSGGGPGAVVLDLAAGTPAPEDTSMWAGLPFVIVGLAGTRQAIPPAWTELLDVVLDPAGAEVDQIAATVAATPIAATTLALLMRGVDGRTVAQGLVAESAAYSTLQAGPEFARWRSDRPRRMRAEDDGPRVRCTRRGGDLEVTLTRPQARNALDAPMRDALHDALLVGVLDQTVERIDLRGEGPSFCAGGDLDEMGRRSDPASAHLIRLHRSPARLLALLAERTTVHLHGPCAGSGIELPAFAGRVLAAPDTTFALPELGLGLVPGAGGTVSLPARIGRHRTAWMALTGQAIGATTAVAWGLADDLEH
jgi:hypothetical protein